MTAFKVINVEPHVREWTPQDGSTMHVDRLTLQNGDQAPVICEQNRKPETPSFSIGDEASGDIKQASDPKYLPTFKKARAGGGFGGGGPRPPEEIAGMRRSASLATAAHNLSPLPLDADGVAVKARLDLLRRMADWLDSDVKQQADAVKAQPPSSPPGSDPGVSSDVPPDESGMGEEGKQDGDDIPF